MMPSDTDRAEIKKQLLHFYVSLAFDRSGPSFVNMGCTTSSMHLQEHCNTSGPMDNGSNSSESRLPDTSHCIPHEDVIKRRLKAELSNNTHGRPRSIELIDSLTSCLCRDCSFGQSQNSTENEWEKIHHQSIQRAVLTDEKEETVYYLNNIKSLLINVFNVCIMYVVLSCL